LRIAIADLHDFARAKGDRQLPVIQYKQFTRELLECSQFVRSDIVPLAFVETVNHEPSIRPPGGDDDPRAAALSPSGQRDPFLHDVTTKIGVDESEGHLGNCAA
jgi:hypothetical protein